MQEIVRTCNACGENNSDFSFDCSICGEKLVTGTMLQHEHFTRRWLCHKCETYVNETLRVCPKCGYSTKWKPVAYFIVIVFVLLYIYS